MPPNALPLTIYFANTLWYACQNKYKISSNIQHCRFYTVGESENHSSDTISKTERIVLECSIALAVLVRSAADFLWGKG